jgi:hypothetical protein
MVGNIGGVENGWIYFWSSDAGPPVHESLEKKACLRQPLDLFKKGRIR